MAWSGIGVVAGWRLRLTTSSRGRSTRGLTRMGGGVDPDGGLDDDYGDALAASWGDEAWDDADVY